MIFCYGERKRFASQQFCEDEHGNLIHLTLCPHDSITGAVLSIEEVKKLPIKDADWKSKILKFLSSGFCEGQVSNSPARKNGERLPYPPPPPPPCAPPVE